MHLTDQEKEILDGKHGEAARISLSVLVDLGELFQAEAMTDISQVHIDTTIYMVDAGVEFAEHMAELGARFAVPASLNPSAIDLRRWREYRTPPDLLENSRRLEAAYLKMGATPTWTCAPYQQGMIPRFGEDIAWGESNAIAFANSIIGARTNRCADLMDICAAIVGKVPRFGLHLEENRKAEMLIQLEDITPEMLADKAVYPLLGFLTGEMAGDRIAALKGIPRNTDTDALKAFSAAAASSGAVGLFHLIGVTPEARTLEMCFQGETPGVVLEMTRKAVRYARERLSTAQGDAADVVVLGCPHFSFPELRYLARLMEGKSVHSNVVFWAFTSRAALGWARNSGILKALENSGVMLFTDGCPLQYPSEAWNFHTAMTDSAKFANYCYSQTGLEVTLGSIEECADTAVRGKICRRDLL
ncbi:aconitase X catalytic domain-containing protein [Desulfococcaceae bacterium HSG8]|nr:aconitase X catalytic domain-containing protein [Desulfococcaceae bacterium HSG8]